MTLPPSRPNRDIADKWLEEARAQIKQERAGMSPEQLMRLERQIESARDRGDMERVRELRRTHYEDNGAPGG